MADILIIEDDITLQKVYREILTQKGYTVSVAGTGQDGLQLLKTTSISLILLDIMLPGGLNGFDVLAQIKRDEQYKNIPVIILSNLDTEKQTAFDYGAADYFFKVNMDLRSLVEKINHLLPA